jgi:translation initiation factor 3 subunit A
LETASTLHLYTEGFRTVEDIFNILQVSHSRRKVAGGSGVPKAKVMAAYYEKLTTLFWVSGNYLFHAFAWYKFYTLCKEYNRGMSIEQKKHQASSVLLAALCIPSVSDSANSSSNDGAAKIKSSVHDDIAKDKTARMASLLGFHTRNPTREALLSELRAKNIMADVPEYLRDLYRLLEENSNPLTLVEKATPLLERLRSENDGEDSLSHYVEPITSVLILKLMHSLSASYHTIDLDHLKSLTSGLGVPFTEIEKAIIASATSKSTKPLHVRIDHRANSLRFGDAGGCAPFESDAMRSQLTNVAKQLSKVCAVINPTDLDAVAMERKALYADVRASVGKEHEDMLARKELIESKKEEAERLAQNKLQEDERKRYEAAVNAKAEEERRLVREQQLREREKLDKIRKEMEMNEKKNILKAMGQNTESMTEAELAAIDADKLVKEHNAKATKKKEEAERKVREMQKKLDYVVRATRIEEVPRIKKRYEESVRAEKEHYEADSIRKAQKAKLQWDDDCKSKKELVGFGVFGCMKSFEKTAMEGRVAQHKISCEKEDENAEELAEMAKLQRARKRKEDEIRRQKEEEEKIKRDEEQKKAEEERQKREDERRRKEGELEEIRRKKDSERQAVYKTREGPPSGGSNAPTSRALDNAAGGKYVPPSSRGGSRAFGGDSASRTSAWGQGRGDSFGGGRYEGGESRGYDRDGGDRGGGGGGGYDRDGDRGGRGGGYDRDGDRGGRGGGGGYDRDRGGGGGYDRNSAQEQPRANSRWN